jgi:hypothetical protein
VESAGNLVVDSHVMNEGNPWAGSGANPWHLDQDTESILFLTNESGQPAHIGFKVTANGSPSYSLTSLLLNPRETRAIDLRKLRDAQKPDFKKSKVPAAASDGSVIWIRGDNLPVMGRLMLIHRRQGMASNYDCNQCACPYTYDPLIDYVYPEGAVLPVGYSVPLTFYGGFQDCNHNAYYYNENGSTSWTPGSGIVKVDSSGNVTAQSAGTTTVTGQYSGYAYVWNQQMWYCSYSLLQGGAGSSICARAPYAAVVVNTQSQGAAGASLCGAMSGWARNVTMQLQDQNGNAIAWSGITMADIISVATPNALGVTSTATYQHNTDPTGSWPDLYVVCSTACPGSTGEADAIQTWTWSGAPLPHPNYVVYKCNSITVDGR